jgi:hypothetical protein
VLSHLQHKFLTSEVGHLIVCDQQIKNFCSAYPLYSSA